MTMEYRELDEEQRDALWTAIFDESDKAGVVHNVVGAEDGHSHIDVIQYASSNTCRIAFVEGEPFDPKKIAHDVTETLLRTRLEQTKTALRKIGVDPDAVAKSSVV